MTHWHDRLIRHRFAPLIAYLLLGVAGVTGLWINQNQSNERQDQATAEATTALRLSQVHTAEELRESQIAACRAVNRSRRQINRNTRTLRALILLEIGEGHKQADLQALLKRTNEVELVNCERSVPQVELPSRPKTSG